MMTTLTTSVVSARRNYFNLSQTSSLHIEYVWIDPDGMTRSKLRVLYRADYRDPVPSWVFDGRLTGQKGARGGSDIFIHPIYTLISPFSGRNDLIALCSSWKSNEEPDESNWNIYCLRLIEGCKKDEPWFEFGQEYIVYDPATGRPYQWPEEGVPPTRQNSAYCNVGAVPGILRDLAEAHIRACAYAGLHIGASSAQSMPGRWKYQVGPTPGIEAGNQLWMSRFILMRVAADFGLCVTFRPCPGHHGWGGSGLTVAFSTRAMRSGDTFAVSSCVMQFEKHKADLLTMYGRHRKNPQTVDHEAKQSISVPSTTYYSTAWDPDIHSPDWGPCAGDRCVVDHRPSSDADPYQLMFVMLQ